jgi:hypothetical protein
MSAYLVEEEAGTCSGQRHPHNGYYAGHFDATDDARSSASWSATGSANWLAAWSVSSPTGRP